MKKPANYWPPSIPQGLKAKDLVDCMVYNRYKLFEGAVIRGPAVVEERESTTVILPRDCGHVDQHCNLMIEIQG